MIPAQTIRSLISPDSFGIEIRPGHKPVAAKADGFSCLVLDDRSRERICEETRRESPDRPDLAKRVETVDLLGRPAEILTLFQSFGGVPGTLSYIISAHNIEHIPDPVRFLSECQSLLAPGGSLFLTMPDRRACFDYFRPASTTADLIAAYLEKRTRPTWTQIFEHRSMACRLESEGRELTSFPLGTPPEALTPRRELLACFTEWKRQTESPDEVVRDAHCHTFSPASLRLVIEDLRFLGLVGLEIGEICQAGEGDNEVYARLDAPLAPSAPLSPEIFYERRHALLSRLRREDESFFR